jgi:hypothetical protein
LNTGFSPFSNPFSPALYHLRQAKRTHGEHLERGGIT